MPGDIKMNLSKKAIVTLSSGEKVQDIKILLCMFWSQFNKKPFKRFNEIKVRSGYGYESGYKLTLLKAMTGISVSNPDYITRRNKRKDFNYERDNQSLIKDERVVSMHFIDNKMCFICLEKAHHRHHILQIQFGGSNSFRNIVHLCRGCHKEVHR